MVVGIRAARSTDHRLLVSGYGWTSMNSDSEFVTGTGKRLDPGLRKLDLIATSLVFGLFHFLLLLEIAQRSCRKWIGQILPLLRFWLRTSVVDVLSSLRHQAAGATRKCEGANAKNASSTACRGVFYCQPSSSTNGVQWYVRVYVSFRFEYYLYPILQWEYCRCLWDHISTRRVKEGNNHCSSSDRFSSNMIMYT